MLSSFRPSILLLLLCRLLAGRELLRRNSKTRILGLRLISWCPSIHLSIYLLPSSCYQFFPLFFSSLFAPTCTSHAPKFSFHIVYDIHANWHPGSRYRNPRRRKHRLLHRSITPLVPYP